MKSLRASLGRLGVPAVDLYQIHGPVSLRSHSAMADALAAAHEAGLVKAVGVSNYSVTETRAIDAELRTRGMRLATNQIEFSLLRRAPETERAARRVPGVGHRAARLLAHRPGSPHRQVLGGPPSSGQAELLQSPHGGRRPGRRRAAARGRQVRGQDAQPGGAQLGDRQGGGPHPRGQEPPPGRRERRCARLADRTRTTWPRSTAPRSAGCAASRAGSGSTARELGRPRPGGVPDGRARTRRLLPRARSPR